MKLKKIFIGFTLIGLFYAMIVSFGLVPKDNYEAVQQEKWVAPVSADKIQNPLTNDAVATKQGKQLYNTYCAVCHGPKGKGDGMAGASLTPKPGNFTTAEVQSQTDGAIYWKIMAGRPPMASYKGLLPENDIWKTINHLRTFKK